MSGHIEKSNGSNERKALAVYQRLRRIVVVVPSPAVAAVIARSAAWRAKVNSVTAQ